MPVYTVALGTDTGTVNGPMGEPVSVPPDRETLRQIADTSGGKAFEATDADSLGAVYEQLGSRIGTQAGVARGDDRASLPVACCSCSAGSGRACGCAVDHSDRAR